MVKTHFLCSRLYPDGGNFYRSLRKSGKFSIIPSGFAFIERYFWFGESVPNPFGTYTVKFRAHVYGVTSHVKTIDVERL